MWRDGAGDDGRGELRPIAEVCDALPPLTADWCALVEFAAAYYQRGVGEVALSVLPPELRRLGATPSPIGCAGCDARSKPPTQAAMRHRRPAPALTPEQSAATAAIGAAMAAPVPGTMLLHGVTGSGKTEVYLRAAEMRSRPGGRRWCWCPRST